MLDQKTNKTVLKIHENMVFLNKKIRPNILYQDGLDIQYQAEAIEMSYYPSLAAHP